MGFVAVLEWMRIATFVVVVVAWFTVGQKRWVKIGIVLLLAEWLASTGLVSGWGHAFAYLAGVVAVVMGASFLALRSWRAPRRLEYDAGAPPGGAGWPSHAAADVERWTRELAALGFEGPADVWYRWRATGTERTSRLRLTRHGTEPVWASIYVGPSTRSTGRGLFTPLVGERWLITEERPSDRALTRDPTSTRVRGSSSDTFARLLARHRARLAQLQPRSEEIHDVIGENARARTAWIEALVARGDALVDGDDVRLSSRAALGATARSLGAFVA